MRSASACVVVAESGGLQTSAALASAIMQEGGMTWGGDLEYQVKGDLAQEAQMLSTYLGFALGTISSGFLGDYAGRRLPIFVAYLGMIFSALGLYLVRSYVSLLGLLQLRLLRWFGHPCRLHRIGRGLS
eukprot:symbB.v1.2.038451.t1/scaffold5994.1/size21901/1